MTAGRLIAVVGPSGVGKDSVMVALAARAPAFALVRRVMTRAPDLGGEEYDAVNVETFEQMVRDGAFAVHWGAHGLFYGIPAKTLHEVEEGATRLANFSRSALVQGAEVFPAFTVLNLTAKPETLGARLRARGRETEEDIAKRLAQAAKPLPEGLDVITISNDGPLEDTVSAALRALQPVRA
jgi:ribose 1,5-bisphosphokinase